MLRTLARRACPMAIGAAPQQRWKSLNIEEIQTALRQMSRKGGTSTKGLDQMREALETLMAEASEKKTEVAEDPSQYFLIHASGTERKGLVADVSKAITTAGVAILSSRATLLGGDFSMMLHIRADETNALDTMNSNLSKITGLQTFVHKTGSSTATSEVGPGRIARVLRLSGNNGTGIINNVVRYLQKRGCSILNLASEVVPGEIDGPPCFKLRLVVDSPGNLKKEEVVAGLGALGALGGKPLRVESFLRCDEDE
eukprot:TRINITY_DN27157_c0_g1_i1.p1 TRINITY_DN27157_c0_g1~~TRINITY_DN27157_c0_g1_i1.p1  ORF type:complete len:256 (+),score=102.77 TRINITY_DN27157_c0_g1_i1:52-819(+)